MMGEVVDDGDTAFHAADFHPPLDSLERLEPFLNLFRRKTAKPRGGNHGQRIEDVMTAGKRGSKSKPLFSFPPRREEGALGSKFHILRDHVARPECDPSRAGILAQAHDV